MLAMLGVILLNDSGANVPSSMLASFFGWIEGYLTIAFQALHAPDWLYGVLILGLFGVPPGLSVSSLPPMAIFFPAFAALENYGYLPRVAFNLDRLFKNGCARQAVPHHGDGIRRNAAAIMSTRIIESPRERMLAILTNNFVPCNGRWPTLILLASLFMVAGFSGRSPDARNGFRCYGHGADRCRCHAHGIMGSIKTALKGIPSHYTLGASIP